MEEMKRIFSFAIRHCLCYKGQEDNNKSRCRRGQVGRQQQQAPVPSQQLSPAMIKATHTFNIRGTLRLSEFCQPYSEDEQQRLIRETSIWCLSEVRMFVSWRICQQTIDIMQHYVLSSMWIPQKVSLAF